MNNNYTLNLKMMKRSLVLLFSFLFILGIAPFQAIAGIGNDKGETNPALAFLANSKRVIHLSEPDEKANGMNAPAAFFSLEADLEIVSVTHTNSPIVPGTTETIEIVVRNNSLVNEASGAIVNFDVVDANWFHDIAFSPANWSFLLNGTAVRVTPMPPGAEETLTISVRIERNAAYVAPDAIGPVWASVAHAGNDPVPGNNQRSTSVSTQVQANLTIQKKLLTKNVAPGGIALYEILVCNSGPSDVAGVGVTDIPGANILPGSVELSPGADNLYIPAGQCRTVIATAVIDPAAAVGATFSNTANISLTNVTGGPGSTLPPAITIPTSGSTDNTGTVGASLGSVDLEIVSVSLVGGGPLVPGTIRNFEVVARNNGPSAAYGATVTMKLFDAPYIINNNNVPAGWLPQGSGGTWMHPGAWASGATSTLIVELIIPSDAHYEAGLPIDDFRAYIAAANPDPNTGNNSGVAFFSCQAQADLTITKTLFTPNVAPGGTALYEISICNSGPSDIAGVGINDIPNLNLDPATLVMSIDANNLYIPAGQCITALASVRVLNSAIPGAAFCNYADINVFNINSGPGSNLPADVDTSGQPNACGQVIDVLPPADLEAVNLQFVTAPFVPGTSETFTFTVRNNGPAPAYGATVVFNLLDTEWSIDNNSTPAGWSFFGNGAFIRTSAMPAGAEESFSITLSIPSNAAYEAPDLIGPFGITVASSNPDPNVNNNTINSFDIESQIQANLNITKTLFTPSVSPGGTALYEITICNTGPSDVSGIAIEDIPGVNLDAATLIMSAYAGDLYLEAGKCESVLVSIQVALTAPEGASFCNAASINTANARQGGTSLAPSITTSAASSACGIVTAPLPPADLEAVSLTFNSPPFVPGSTETFSFTVRNNGPSDALGATVVFNLLDTEWSIDNNSAPAGWSFFGNGTFVRTTAMPSGAEESFSISLIIPSNAAYQAPDAIGPFSITVASSSPDPNISNNTLNSFDIPSQVQANLTITKTLFTPEVAPGSLAFYEISVCNDGPSDVSGVAITDIPGINLVPGTLVLSADADDLYISAGQCKKIFVSVQVSPAAVPGSTFCNAAEVDASDVIAGATTLAPLVNEPATGNVCGTVVNILPETDVELVSIVHNNSPVVPGTPASFTVTVRNNGPTQALGALLLIDFVDVNWSVDNYFVSNNDWFFFGNGVFSRSTPMPAGAVETFTLILNVPSDAYIIARPDDIGPFYATITAVNPDPVPSNNTSFISLAIQNTADLSITKSLVNPPVNQGQTAIFNIVVNNAGPSDVDQVGIVDVLVGQASFVYFEPFYINNFYVPAGQSRSFLVSAQVNPDGCGMIENCAFVSSPTYNSDPNPNNNGPSCVSFMIGDTTPPVIICPDDLVIECGDPDEDVFIQAWLRSATATDICDPDVDITFNLVFTDNGCGLTRSEFYWFIATDDSGNSASCYATVHIVDNTPPEITGGEDNVVECVLGGAGNDSEFLSWLNTRGGATATDNCSNLIFWTNDFDEANWVDGCNNIRYIDVTFTATDECGNASAVTLRFGYIDTQDPIFLNCPRPDIVVKAAPGMCGNFVNFSLPIAIDNCDLLPELRKVDDTGLTSGDMFPVGNTILIWEAEDCSGNISVCEIKIFVNDNDIPEIECPADVVQDNDPGECGAIVNNIDPEFSDLCIDNVALIYAVTLDGEIVNSGLGSASGQFFEVGESEVKYKVQDQPLVLISEVTQLITNPNGATNPIPAFILNNVITGDDYLEITNFGPAAVDLGCMNIERVGTLNNPLNEQLMIPNGTVLLPGQVLTIHFGPGTDDPANRFFNIPNATNVPSNVPAGYIISLKGRVIDVVTLNGYDPTNQGTLAVVSANDWTGSIPVITNQGGAYRTRVWDTNSANDWALADVCELATIGTYNPVFPAPFNNGTTTSLQHQAPNMAMCTFTVTIDDVEAPVCGELDYFTYSGAGGATIPNGVLSRSVNVPQNFEVGRVRILNLIGTHTNVGQLVFKLTSPSGTQVIMFGGLCFGSTAFNLNLDDRAAGSVTMAPCNPLGQGGFFAPENGFFEFYGENSQGSWTLEVADMSTGVGNLSAGWTLELGQRLPYSQGDVLINNDPGLCGAEFTWNHPEIFDNCPDGTIEVIYSSADGINVPAGGFVTPGAEVTEFFEVGTTRVEYILTDASGNQTICGFDVTVIDNELPVVVCPDNVIINLLPGECRAQYDFNVNAEDNCGILSVERIPASGVFFEIGITTVTIIVTDVNGNTASCTFTVEVREFPNPTSSLACNNAINISLGPDCEAEVNADMLLEGGPYRCYEDYIVQVGTGMPPNFVPIPTSPVFNTTHIGQQFVGIVTDPITGNSCWGFINVEYKIVPDFDCPADLTLTCNESIDPSYTGEIVINSCVMDGVIYYEDIDQQFPKCEDPRLIIDRTWTVIDAFGNSATCHQQITVERADLEEVVFPADYNDFDLPSFTCQEVEANPALLHPDNTGRPMLGGQILRGSELCEVSINYMDKIYDICGGSYEILRMWSVRNYCQPIRPGINPRDYTQIIQVFDKQGPVIDCGPQIVVSTGFYTCDAEWIAENYTPNIIESCSDIANIRIIKPRANNRYPVGTHTIRYIVTDECGKRATCDVSLRVVDQVLPSAICESFRVVSLGPDCRVRIPASSFDDGSYDNCAIDRFEVARMTTSQCYSPASQALVFRDSVDFCCADIGATEAQRRVIFRVIDAAGNSNTCMVSVEVQDKLVPVITCPVNETVECLEHFGLTDDELAARFGTATATDNCGDQPALGCTVNVTVVNSVDLECRQGTITRVFTATDGAGNTARCTQVITIVNNYPFDGGFYRVFAQLRNAQSYPQYPNGPYEDNTPAGQKVFSDQSRANLRPINTLYPTRWDIVWPADLEVDFCGQALEPDALRNNPRFVVGAYPHLHREDLCSQIGMSYDEWEFDFDAGCKKVIRRWKVIDWCQPETVFSPWMWDQVIKVIDNEGPQILAGPYSFCITAENCQEPVVIEASATDNCASGDQLRWDWEVFPFGDRNQVIRNNIPNLRGDNLTLNRVWPATPDNGPAHIIKFVVEDGCGNKSTREVEFRIRDCKKPTPICYDGLAVDLMPTTGMADVAAVLWDAGSYDNCTARENLRFRIERLADGDGTTVPAATVLTVDCDDLGSLLVRLWVGDEFGNWDFCETYIIVQNNMGADCGDDLNGTIAGRINTTMGETLNGVSIELRKAGQIQQSFQTELDGEYTFIAPLYNSYRVVPEKNDGLLNGVTTTDILLIQRHILGVSVLDNPFSLIAADVNKSGSISAADLAEIRKAILGKSTAFANNKSWRFVPAGHEFLNSDNAHAESFPEYRLVDPFFTDRLNEDFFGVKIGDVNGSARANQFSTLAGRGGSAFELNTDDLILSAGNEYQVQIKASDINNVLGYQYTLNFNPEVLTFKGFEGGTLNLSDENFGFTMLSQGLITSSWNVLNPVGVDSKEALFTLKFTANKSARLSDVLTVNSRFTQAEAIGLDINEVDLRLVFNALEEGAISSTYELYQNIPNPFVNETLIGFNLPESMAATLTVFDVSGKVVKQVVGDYYKGFNTVVLDRSELPAAGVMYYQLEAGSFKATKKMIIID